MTAPAEVVIDRLVLGGVSGSDASAVVTAFRSHLVALLAGTPPTDAPADDAERHGRELAAAVARSIRCAGGAP
jgi:hypothetical protein